MVGKLTQDAMTELTQDATTELAMGGELTGPR
jgi:hypothetical protein